MKNIQAKIEIKLAKQSGVSLILVILAMTIMSILMIPLTRWWVNLNGNLNMSEQRVAMQGIAMNQLGDLSQESYEDLIDYFVDGVDPNQGTATSLSEVMNSKTEDGYYTGSVGNDKYVWKLEKIEGVRVVTQYTYGQANESISASGTASGGGYFMENGACKYMASVSYSDVTNQPNPCMLVTVSVSDGTNRDYSQSFYKRSNLLRTWRYVVNRNHTDRRVLGLKELSGNLSSPNFAIDVDGSTFPIYTKAQVDTKFNELQQKLQDTMPPVGTIVAYSGKSIPKGWALCDGSNGTPDLRDRFLMGWGNNNVMETLEAGLPNIKGRITSTDNEPFTMMDSHEQEGAILVDDQKRYVFGAYEGGGDGYRTLKIDASLSNPIYGKSNTVQPPSYVVYYIMRIS